MFVRVSFHYVRRKFDFGYSSVDAYALKSLIIISNSRRSTSRNTVNFYLRSPFRYGVISLDDFGLVIEAAVERENNWTMTFKNSTGGPRRRYVPPPPRRSRTRSPRGGSPVQWDQHGDEDPEAWSPGESSVRSRGSSRIGSQELRSRRSNRRNRRRDGTGSTDDADASFL